MTGIHLPRGATLLNLARFVDDRGELGVIEDSDLGFSVRRVFFIRVDDPNIERASHAVSAVQGICCPSGRVDVEIDNGHEKASVTLSDPTALLKLEAGVWRKLYNFAPGTLVLVAASLPHKLTNVYDRPQPGLVEESLVNSSR